jgi:hypothetical protein
MGVESLLQILGSLLICIRNELGCLYPSKKSGGFLDIYCSSTQHLMIGKVLMVLITQFKVASLMDHHWFLQEVTNLCH